MGKREDSVDQQHEARLRLTATCTRAESKERKQEETRQGAFLKTAEERYSLTGQVGSSHR